MCGISGYFDLSGRSERPDAQSIAAQQVATYRYRGPDAVGIHTGPGLALGHARLSIIDVSHAADQPFYSDDKEIVVVFNGEIYNFQEIRRTLESKGHVFRTNSDTEVIVRGYQTWGIDVVQKLRGMFAIAIYDSRADRLVLLRDRIGKKPLYYGEVDGHLVFASEIKGILAFPGAQRTANYDAIHEYLTFQYVPAPLSAFEGIHKLPPSHLAILERGKPINVKRYYNFPPPSAGRARPLNEMAEELAAELQEATKLRMISDVPLGAFLSGGVDSSAVVATMATVSDDPVNTFTIGFDEQAYDEREYARAVSERYGTNHREMIVKPDGMAILSDLVYHYGEPYADSSAIPTYYVSKIAREHVTVILSGDGGDESFLGYARYALCREKDPGNKLPRPMMKKLIQLLGGLPPSIAGHSKVANFRERLSNHYGPHSRRYEQAIAYFSDLSKDEIYAGPFRDKLKYSALDRLDQYFDQAQTMAQGAAWADIHTYLPDDLLVKVDIASMANSLEVRAPFLDHKLMEWAARIPEEQKFGNGELKLILKKAMEPYLPHDLMYRPKMGFGVPIDVWLRGEMKDFAYETLLGTRARQRGLFNPTVVESLLERHCAGENWAIRIWALLMLEMWFTMWIDPTDVFAEPTPSRIISKFAESPVAA